MKALLKDLFLSPFGRKIVAEAYGSTSRTTKPIDGSKHLNKADSQLWPKVEVHEPTIVHEHADFSVTSELQSSASSCDSQSEINIDDTDDASNGLSMMTREVHSDGTTFSVKGKRSNIFQSECHLHDKVCKMIIDGGSFANVISSDLVNALSLSTRRLPMPALCTMDESKWYTKNYS